MSPVGGVGINLAIQDAVAAANILGGAAPPRAGADWKCLSKVQKRRQWPTEMMQGVQLLVQKRIISNVLALHDAAERAFRGEAAAMVSVCCAGFPARLIGMGFRPEHVRSPEITPAPLPSA